MKKILVIDDDAAVRATLRRILQSAGYEVACAADGREGMQSFRELGPDLVITDIIMPEQEGIETILQIRAAWPQGPILAISGGGRIGNADFLDMATRLGASEVLAKPFQPQDLLARVEACLAGPPPADEAG